jgi:hypothetical protein
MVYIHGVTAKEGFVMPTVVPRGNDRRTFSLQLATCVILAWAIDSTCPSTSQAGKLETYLTHADLSGRVVLDQNGEELTLPSPRDRHPSLANGSTPTYLAIPLNGGEHLPGSLPIIDAVAQQGQTTVGPLNLDALVKGKLDAILDSSRLAIVDAPGRNYLVEFLPSQVRLISGKEKADGSTTNPVKELTHLVNIGSNQWSKWTQSGMNELERFLNLSNSKTPSSKPSLNLEAQLVGAPLAAPIPEPSTWLIFAALFAGANALKFGVKT